MLLSNSLVAPHTRSKTSRGGGWVSSECWSNIYLQYPCVRTGMNLVLWLKGAKPCLWTSATKYVGYVCVRPHLDSQNTSIHQTYRQTQVSRSPCTVNNYDVQPWTNGCQPRLLQYGAIFRFNVSLCQAYVNVVPKSTLHTMTSLRAEGLLSYFGRVVNNYHAPADRVKSDVSTELCNVSWDLYLAVVQTTDGIWDAFFGSEQL